MPTVLFFILKHWMGEYLGVGMQTRSNFDLSVFVVEDARFYMSSIRLSNPLRIIQSCSILEWLHIVISQISQVSARPKRIPRCFEVAQLDSKYVLEG